MEFGGPVPVDREVSVTVLFAKERIHTWCDRPLGPSPTK